MRTKRPGIPKRAPRPAPCVPISGQIVLIPAPPRIQAPMLVMFKAWLGAKVRSIGARLLNCRWGLSS